MFREISYITLILSAATFGTEISKYMIVLNNLIFTSSIQNHSFQIEPWKSSIGRKIYYSGNVHLSDSFKANYTDFWGKKKKSNIVIASAVIEIAASLVILRYIEKIPKLRMKILMLVILTPLITAIVLRSKYNFFMPLEHKRFSKLSVDYQISPFFFVII